MADLFTTVVTSPLAKKAGVPQPTRLRRFTPGDPMVEGPVLVAFHERSVADDIGRQDGRQTPFDPCCRHARPPVRPTRPARRSIDAGE